METAVVGVVVALPVGAGIRVGFVVVVVVVVSVP